MVQSPPRKFKFASIPDDLTGDELERLIFRRDSLGFRDFVPDQQTYRRCMSQVIRRHLPDARRPIRWNCHTPNTPIARSLYWHVVKRLPERYRPSLRLFNAIGTTLDYWHGVDAFFWWQDARPRCRRAEAIPRTVTIDVAVFAKPDYKANFLLTLEDIRLGRMKDICRQIAEQLLGRRTPRGIRSAPMDSRLVLRV